MAFLGEDTLTELLENSDTISPFNSSRIKNGAYELSLGEQVFHTNSIPRSVQKLEVDDETYIEPGQFALLLTEEKVNIPKNKIAFISIKARIKFKGLVNVSGFHVDPGFRGKLLFSVYNAGPSRIVLRRGKNYFPIWFADLSEEQEYKGNHINQNSIPIDPIESLSQGELNSPEALNKKIDDSNSRITSLEKDHKATNYIAVTALGFIAAVILKLCFDWYALEKGWQEGINHKEKEIQIDSIINSKLEEKQLILLEIDSLMGIRDSINAKE